MKEALDGVLAEKTLVNLQAKLHIRSADFIHPILFTFWVITIYSKGASFSNYAKHQKFLTASLLLHGTKKVCAEQRLRTIVHDLLLVTEKKKLVHNYT